MSLTKQQINLDEQKQDSDNYGDDIVQPSEKQINNVTNRLLFGEDKSKWIPNTKGKSFYK